MKTLLKLFLVLSLIVFSKEAGSGTQDQSLPDFFQVEDDIWASETVSTAPLPKERNKYLLVAYNLGDPATTPDYVDGRQGIVYKSNPPIKLCWNGEDITDPLKNNYDTNSNYQTGIVTTNNGGNPINFGTFTVNNVESTTNAKMLYENTCQADPTTSRSIFFPFWVTNNQINDEMTTWFRFKLVNTDATNPSRITFQLERYDSNGYLKATSERVDISSEITVPPLEVYEVEISVERILNTSIATIQDFPDFTFTTYVKNAVIINYFI